MRNKNAVLRARHDAQGEVSGAYVRKGVQRTSTEP